MKTPLPNTDLQVIAVLHRAGRVWRGLIVALRNGKPVVQSWKEFPADQINSLDAWLDEHRAASVLCVLPAGAVICRNSPLPNASDEQLDQALHLQAEAHLLGIVPPHRLAMAVIPHAAGETTRTGLVLAWPEAAAFSAPPTNRPMRFVPDVAAMAAILNSNRPDESLLFLDREDGSVGLAICHAGGAIFRATREQAASLDAWQRSIGGIAGETGLSVGHTGAFIESLVRDAQGKAGSLRDGEAALFLPNELINNAASRLQGVDSDPNWWRQYGVAAGAALARSNGGETSRGLSALTYMQDAPPVEAPSPMRSIMERLSHPRAAAVVVGICVILLMLTPIVASGMRLLALKVRFSGVEQKLVSAVAAKQQVAMYKELERQNVWPMTKLLADITTYTPIGIELESIRIEGGKDFAIGGTAISNNGQSPGQIVAQMQENLSRDGMFAEIALKSGKTDNLGRYKFDIQAKIAKPFMTVKLTDDIDFIKTPYAVMLYGEDARPKGSTSAKDATKPTSASASKPQPHTDVPDTAIAQVPTEENNSENTADNPGETRSNRMNQNIEGVEDPTTPGELHGNTSAPPPPIDVEQIKVMSKAELKDALLKVDKARGNRDLDKDVQARLKQEHQLIMDYLRKAPNS